QIPTVTVPDPSASGQNTTVSWRVENHGIGLTNTSNWTDYVWLTTDPNGVNNRTLLGSFTHLGQLAVGDGYDRTATVRLPDGISGTYYIVVQTGGPFEFLYTNNDTTVSNPFTVNFTPPPDLAVTDIVAPTLPVQENTLVDIQWTVTNAGTGVAAGYWMD